MLKYNTRNLLGEASGDAAFLICYNDFLIYDWEKCRTENS